MVPNLVNSESWLCKIGKNKHELANGLDIVINID